jgi:hypothetical protein
MGQAASVRPIFAGDCGVYSVQNPFISGPEAEVRRRKTVADVAKDSGVQHFGYGSVGVGRKRTGILSWETKAERVEMIVPRVNDQGRRRNRLHTVARIRINIS